jgi:hypothetical protein
VRHKDVFERLVAQWNEWNSTMLPLDPQSFTAGHWSAARRSFRRQNAANA